MSYLVLARKYRPQTFDEIVGQEHVTRTLSNAFEQDRVHHAFLFCGPRGVGKTTAARILGKALNCEHGPTAHPDNTCSACTSISAGTAVDYYEMDGASNRGIDSIRELTEAVRYQPAALRKKVYVIDEVHMLTTEAFNALLKTLEEPPPHVCFVLATTEPHKLPNTILSRCQRYDFKLVPSTRLAEHVTSVFAREEIEIEPAATSLVVRESGGSVRDAMSICDQVISYVGKQGITEAAVAEVLGLADRALTTRIVDALAGGDAKTALSAVDSAVGRGIGEVQLARALVGFVRDLAVVQATGDGAGVVEGSPDELVELRERAAGLEPSRLRLMFERLLKACEDLAQSQQPRMVLDLAIIDLATTEPLEPLGDLLDRLVDLEKGLAAGGAGQGARPPRQSNVSRRPESANREVRREPAPKQAVRSAVTSEPAPAAKPERGKPVDEDEFAPPASWSEVPPIGESLEPQVDERGPGGQPRAADGQRSTATGERSTATGERRPADGQRSTATGDRPAANGQRPAANGDRRTANGQQPAADGQRRTANGERPAANGQRPAANGQRRTATGQQPAADGRQPAANGARSARVAPAGAMDLSAWEGVIASLEEQRKLALVRLFQEAKLLTCESSKIVVAFPKGTIDGELASDKERVAEMTEALIEHFARPIEFEVQLLTESELSKAGPSAFSLVERTQAAKAEEREAREREAREHPMTKLVLDTFGATIKEIKTDV